MALTNLCAPVIIRALTGGCMQGSLDQPPIVVRGSRARAIWLVIGSAIFVAIGVFLWSPTQSAVMRWSCIGFFGLCGALGLAILIVPSRLEVGPSGLTQTVLWRTGRFTWTDVYNFRPAIIGLTNKTVGFDYLTPRPRRTALKSLNAGLAGVQGSLQPGWEVAPEALASLLNEARERWLVGAEIATQPLPAPTPRPQSSLAAALAGTRINRKIFWLATVIIFGIVIVVSFIPPLRGFVRYLTLFLFIRVYAARLHDFGRSAWWQAIMYVLQFALVIALSLGVRHQFGVAILAGFLVQLTFTIVLGVIAGDRSANRFGPPPDQPDLSPTAVSETFR
jgi:uncharacterized membrane protein YhaH (DUF805 family)